MFASGSPMLSIFLPTLHFICLVFWTMLILHIMRGHDLSGWLKVL